MDIRKVKSLIDLLEQSGIDELEISEGEESVRIRRHRHLVTTPAMGATSQATSTQATAAVPVLPAKARPSPQNQTEETNAHRSPMVGTFYRSASPTSPAFVEVGQSVNKGDVLCIVEAMKMMNHIEADASGVIASILVADGDPVEHGQPLFTFV
ncbi:acetyl-CoA carboxylase biotin carboxyl carrier protein [Pseudomonas sp. PSKL.D1]|uniref:acetyl-CoA carboxylase biotin carboxyl carrier protein n=1 Tax=Pseudomonas sp. PSKL.D1 TaxID=3029060 RepID=UPI00238154D7|nr:acetyl-CoA carboxylase biotin carboxyl carrier protein [Pseudomonas sp. PSKL.D1]WDY55781.1 acetyl-CoA carboxylase biotin carboxyl carrier protein [Pseudomonas sp. PSKL.D1]